MRPSDHARALSRGREAYEAKAWEAAFEALSLADAEEPLASVDLERLTWAAGLTARDEAFISLLERMHHTALSEGQLGRAARCGFWLGMRLMLLGEMGRASGWLSRAQRLAERDGPESVEAGYLLLPAAYRHLALGEVDAAMEAASRAVAIGERCGDADLVCLARSTHGKTLVADGQVREGLALLDESMVAATGGALSPIVTGIVYCAVIACCQRVYALDRAREWTSALSRWCDAQPELVAFTGSCMVHRAEVLQLGGDWARAIEEARRASAGAERDVVGEAWYQQGEIHRLRGEVGPAEDAYRRASQAGTEPMPGLALLRLAQGRKEQAASAIHRALAATPGALERVRFLPAAVEILLVAGQQEQAQAVCAELEATAARFAWPVLGAVADHARGALAIAAGDPTGAIAPLRRAFHVWQQLGAPYLASRIRVTLARCCRALGDEDGVALELDAAREVFARLGAAPDLAALDELRPARSKDRHRGLTGRELEVLRLVACGKTNKEVAAELGLSERTVDRHVSNIFVKLNVSTRAAATAHAYEHGLV
jgi:DNA-binding CsgD family transcriptional regulator